MEQTSTTENSDEKNAAADIMQSAAALKIERLNYLIAKMRDGKHLSANEFSLLSRIIDSMDTEENGKERFKNSMEVAKWYGVSQPTVAEHVKRGNISPNLDGTFDKEICDAYWVTKRGRQYVPLNGTSKTVDEITSTPEHSLQHKIDTARLKKLKAEAETKELLAQQLRGSMISKDDMIKIWCSRVAMFRDAMLHLPVRLPPVLVNLSQNEIAQILRNEIESILKAFAKHGKYTPRESIGKRKISN